MRSGNMHALLIMCTRMSMVLVIRLLKRVKIVQQLG